MKSLIGLVTALLADASVACVATTTRDVETIVTRVKHEGLSFLTITLPDFCDDFERSLREGQIGSDCFKAFKRASRQSALPAFLQGLTNLVFDSRSGALLEDPSVDAIFFVRQVCRVFKKVQLPCSPERTDRAFRKYLECEVDVAQPHSLEPQELRTFLGVARILVLNAFATFEKEAHTLVPRHGPGATADKLMGNQKFLSRTWHRRLDVHFPAGDYMCSSYEHTMSPVWGLDSLTLTSPKDEAPVKVISVPKTLKGPRIIAIEPVCMQYTQQALSTWMVAKLEQPHPRSLTSGHVNFTSQEVNRRLALTASRDQRLATLDLSEASDRVKASVVSQVFKVIPALRAAIFACRSSRARLPHGEVIPLKKFASMGSALCFPVESLVFYACIVAARLLRARIRPSYESVRAYSRDTYVYGDDLIVPADEAQTVAELLGRLGLKVNTAKSFWTGKFRESCGMDAYDGYQVTPVYLRQMLPCNRHSPLELVSGVSFGNQLYRAGCWRASQYVRDHIEGVYGQIPYTLSTSSGVGWWSFRGSYTVGRWNPSLARWEAKLWSVTPVRKRDLLDDYPALLKCLLRIEGQTQANDNGKHLEESVRRGAVNAKRRWLAPY